MQMRHLTTIRKGFSISTAEVVQMAAGKDSLPGGKSELRRAWRWVTSSGGDSKESATESKPPASAGKGETVG